MGPCCLFSTNVSQTNKTQTSADKQTSNKHNTHTNRQTDGRTDRQTDRQTDKKPHKHNQSKDTFLEAPNADENTHKSAALTRSVYIHVGMAASCVDPRYPPFFFNRSTLPSPDSLQKYFALVLAHFRTNAQVADAYKACAF